jgi:RNA polymerase sigma-70 factor, ECF subfamily
MPKRPCVSVSLSVPVAQHDDASGVWGHMTQGLEPIAPAPLVVLEPVRGGQGIELTIAAVFDAFEGRLKAFALAAVRDGAAADDLVQESFLRLLREMRAGRPPENVEGWLFRVCANLIASRGRRRSVAEKFKNLLVDRGHVASPEELVLGRERDRRVAKALSVLRPDARAALLLAAQGLPSAEIGAAIGRTTLATRTLIHRSRLRLREALTESGEEARP